MELPGHVPESLCNFIIDNFEKDSEKFVGVMNYGGKYITDKTLKDSTEVRITGRGVPVWRDVDKIKVKYIITAVEKYTQCLSEDYPGPEHPENKQKLRTFQAILNSIEQHGTCDGGYSIQRQSRGVKYGWHFDSMTESYLFGILYLNTLSEGSGCTEFINGRKIQPEVGKIMLSPAHWSYAHCGNEVKDEYKYTIPFIVHNNKVPKDFPCKVTATGIEESEAGQKIVRNVQAGSDTRIQQGVFTNDEDDLMVFEPGALEIRDFGRAVPSESYEHIPGEKSEVQHMGKEYPVCVSLK